MSNLLWHAVYDSLRKNLHLESVYTDMVSNTSSPFYYNSKRLPDLFDILSRRSGTEFLIRRAVTARRHYYKFLNGLTDRSAVLMELQR